LIITRVSDGKQVIFSITNTASDLSGEVSLPCSYVSGLTSLTDEDSVSIIFLPTGNDGAGTGDVIGPASSTDNTLPRFNGSGGKTIQASSIVVDDSNNISGINNTTGSDTDLVSGTAGTSGHSAIWNVDGDLVGSGTLETDYYRVGGTDVPVTDGGTGASTATNARTNLSAAAMSQTFGLSGLIATPSNKDFRIVVNIPFAGTITKVTTRSASGTCTATFKVNTTALGGTANSVSSTEQEQAHASSNTFSVGDDIVITVSSNSSCVDMSFTILYTRTLS
jgi:hypothetical protein